MDENQFRILIRTLEQMARTLMHLVAVIEKSEQEREAIRRDVAGRGLAPDGPAKPLGGPL